MQKTTVADSIYIFDNSPCDERWMMKLQDLQTIQTCHCQRMSGTWHHDMPQHSAILRSPPHTRPWPPRRQSGCHTNWWSRRTSLSSAPRPRPGNGDRARLASSSRALPFKSWSLKSGEHMTFNSDMWISLIQNLANNAESDSCWQHLHIWQLSLRWKMNYIFDNSPCDERWMMKLQHLQTIQTSDCKRISKTLTSWHAAAFSDSAAPIPHTRPWRPRRQSRWIPNWCSWRTSLSSVPRPRPGGSDRSRLSVKR